MSAGKTYHTCINQGVLEVCVSFQKLFLKELGVLEGIEEANVDIVSRRKVFQLDGLQEVG